MAADSRGYCSTCGEWSIHCQLVDVYGKLEKVCDICREIRYRREIE